jgi:signal transduction histidine kinase/ActR/RegA family two-component response regulator
MGSTGVVHAPARRVAATGGFTATLAEVDISSELQERPRRAPVPDAEDRALGALAKEMAENPRNMLQKLVEIAVELCDAHTAGISLLEGDVFRWEAVAGVFASHRNGTMPRAASPCGVCIDRDATQLMDRPERCFPALQAEPSFVEALLIPFHDHGVAVGTVWIVSHSPERKFDREDERIVRVLAQFASAGWQLWKASMAAAEVSRRQDEFLATLSHELRTPLNAILGWVSLVRSGQLDRASSGRAIEVIERTTHRLGALVADLFEVSRMATGKTALKIEALDLGKVIEASIEAVRPLADAKRITIRSELPVGAVLLLGDAERLQQVVWNLLENAMKFTLDGGGVEVRLASLTKGARVTVSDTGKGIEPAFLSHVFDRFQQADGPPTGTHAGLGLGLAIVRQLVEAHGGTVRAESTGAGMGATFIVELPHRVHRRGTPRQPRGVVTPPPVRSPAALRGMRVLVVDDSAETCELLALILRVHGVESSSTSSPREALRLLGHVPLDAVVCDIAMPEMDGLQLIRRLRSSGGESARIIAVALSGYTSPEDRANALAAGFDGYMAKPIDPAELVGVIAQIAEGRVGSPWGVHGTSRGLGARPRCE